jgi:hypothetical protein
LDHLPYRVAISMPDYSIAFSISVPTPISDNLPRTCALLQSSDRDVPPKT